MAASNVSIRVVTPSFRGDFERCAAMCASFDAFAEPAFHHQVIVPRRDLARFRDLANARREVLCVEDVLPGFAFQLPVRKERWLLGRWHRRGGWLVQQLVKVAAARPGGVDAVVFADSDIVLIRPLRAADFLEHGRVRLYRSGGTDHYRLDPNYPKWYRGAAQLLDIPIDDPYPAHFVGQLESWAPEVVEAMCERIEQVSGRPWMEAVSRLTGGVGFSEYTTYGVFVDSGAAGAAERHFIATRSLCHLSWNHDLGTRAGRDAFVAGLQPEAVAVLIQSNLKLPPPEWRALLEALTAADRDAPAHGRPAAGMP
ncbi:MAG: DUF6492 family protein [Alphaproteobacteria bacterium]